MIVLFLTCVVLTVVSLLTRIESTWWEGSFSSQVDRPPSGFIISGISANHFSEVQQMIVSAQQFLPQNWSILVYDLVGDLSNDEIHHIKSWCNVSYVHVKSSTSVEFDKSLLTNSAWKALIIKKTFKLLPVGSIVVYADASQVFKTSLAPIIDIVQRVGIVGRPTVGPLADFTHPDTFLELSKILPSSVVSSNISDYVEVPIICGCITFWLVDPIIESLILKPFLECSMNKECILPKGASGLKINNKYSPTNKCVRSHRGTCHRGDQSVLSTILYGYYVKINSKRNGTNKAINYPYKLHDLNVDTKRDGHAKKTPAVCGSKIQSFNSPP